MPHDMPHDKRVKDYELTGEFREPKDGDLFLPVDLSQVELKKGYGHPGERHIVRKKQRGAKQASEFTFEELSAELMRRFEVPGKLLGGQWLPEITLIVQEDEAEQTEADAREAALLALTKLALCDQLPQDQYIQLEAAKVILQYGMEIF